MKTQSNYEVSYSIHPAHGDSIILSSHEPIAFGALVEHKVIMTIHCARQRWKKTTFLEKSCYYDGNLFESYISVYSLFPQKKTKHKQLKDWNHLFCDRGEVPKIALELPLGKVCMP